MMLVRRFIRNETGATAVEYALILAGIAIALIASLPLLSAAIKTVLGNVSSNLS